MLINVELFPKHIYSFLVIIFDGILSDLIKLVKEKDDQ